MDGERYIRGIRRNVRRECLKYSQKGFKIILITMKERKKLYNFD